jgi:acyl-CoA dehydrogenase
MAIDFSLPPDVEAIRQKVREFMDTVVRPGEEKLSADHGHEHWPRDEVVALILEGRAAAKEWGVWLPHMPPEYGGLGLRPTAMAFVSAESARRPPTRATCTRCSTTAPRCRRSSTCVRSPRVASARASR